MMQLDCLGLYREACILRRSSETVQYLYRWQVLIWYSNDFDSSDELSFAKRENRPDRLSKCDVETPNM